MIIVMRDHAADGDSAMRAHVRECGFKLGAADVFKINVDAVRCRAA